MSPRKRSVLPAGPKSPCFLDHHQSTSPATLRTYSGSFLRHTANEPLVARGNFSDSCLDCNVTWSHVYLTPVTTTFTTTPHAWITSTVTSISTPRWNDLYLGCGGCANRDSQLRPATIDLSKATPPPRSPFPLPNGIKRTLLSVSPLSPGWRGVQNRKK